MFSQPSALGKIVSYHSLERHMQDKPAFNDRRMVKSFLPTVHYFFKKQANTLHMFQVAYMHDQCVV